LIYRELRDGKGPSRIGYSAHWRADNDNPALASFSSCSGSVIFRLQPDFFVVLFQRRDPSP
jgi:hypothetical protein